MTKRISKLNQAVLSALTFGATMAFTLPAAQGATAIEEVVVTAQRTEESLQEVPISVTALTGEMLEDKGIINPSDLQMSAPNVSFTATNFGDSSFSIRGIGRLVISSNADSGVSTHLNEIPLNTNLNAVEYYDVERVEILRGPQGTLYGRNATGGAINMVTKMPDYDALGGFADAEIGNYGHLRLKGAINLPVGENMGFRLAAMQLERDGYTENLAAKSVSSVDGSRLTGIDDDIDGRDIITYRATYSWDFNENGNLWVQYNYLEEDDDRARLTNQVCKRTELPALGCDPNERGFDAPHLGSTTAGIFLMTNGQGPKMGESGYVVLNQGSLPAGTPGGPNDKNVVYDHAPTEELGLRKVFTDFEPKFYYEEEVLSLGAEYEFNNFTLGLLGAYQETEYVSQMDYNLDVGPLLHPSPLFNGRHPTSIPSGSAPGGDLRGTGGCSYHDGTAGVFGGCVNSDDGKRVFAMDQASSTSETWTMELRLASQLDGMVNFQVGYSIYQTKRTSNDYYVNANGLDSLGIFGSMGVALYPTMFNVPGAVDEPGVNEGDALFGEVYFDITEKLKLTFGVRYNRDEKFVNSANAFVSAINQNAVFLGALIAAGADPDMPATFGTTLQTAIQGMQIDADWAKALAMLPGSGSHPLDPAQDPLARRWARGAKILTGATPGDKDADGNARTLGTYTDTDRARMAFFGISDADIDAAEKTPAFSPERAAIAATLGPITGFNEIRSLSGNPDTDEWTATTGRIGLDYQITDDVLLFGFFSRGYKPGGFNPPIVPEFQDDTSFVFAEEEVDAWEFGFKSTVRDGQLVLNGSIFWYDYTGLQVTRIRNNSSINENIDADIKGAELEWIFQPSGLENLVIDGSFSFLDTELQDVRSVDVTNKTGGNSDWVNLKNIDPGALTGTNYIARADLITDALILAAYTNTNMAGDPAPAALSHLVAPQGSAVGAAVPGTVYPAREGSTLGIPAYFSRAYLTQAIGAENVSSGLPIDISGNSLPNAPEYTFRLGTQYTWAIAAFAGDLTLRWDYYWQDDSYAREFNTVGDEIDSWDQHNLSLIYESNNGQWQGRLWVRNLQDEDNVTGHYLTSDTSGYFRNYFLTEPQVFGLSVRYQLNNDG